MPFFSAKKSPGTVLMLFLESGSIEAAIISFTNNATEILLTEKEKLASAETPDAEALKRKTISACTLLLEKIFTSNAKLASPYRITRIVIVLGSAWYANTQVIAELNKSQPSFIDEKEIRNALEKNFKQAAGNFTVIEENIITIRANGYELHSIQGKKSRTISAEANFTVADPLFVASLEAEAKKHFTGAVVSFKTLPTLAAQVLGKEYDVFLLIVSEDEITEMSIIKKGGVLRSISIPYGKNYLVRTLVNEKAAADTTSAETLLSLYTHDKTVDMKTTQINSSLKTANEMFSNEIRKALFNVLIGEERPAKAFIVSSSEELQEFWQGVIEHLHESLAKDPAALDKNIATELYIPSLKEKTAANSTGGSVLLNPLLELVAEGIGRLLFSDSQNKGKRIK